MTKSPREQVYDKLFRIMGGAIPSAATQFLPPEITHAHSGRHAHSYLSEQRPKVYRPGNAGSGYFMRSFRGTKEDAFQSRFYSKPTCDIQCSLLINNMTGHAAGMKHGKSCKARSKD